MEKMGEKDTTEVTTDKLDKLAKYGLKCMVCKYFTKTVFNLFDMLLLSSCKCIQILLTKKGDQFLN